MRFFYKFFGDVDIEFKNVVEVGDFVVIVVGEGDVFVVIGKGGKNIKVLIREFGKCVRVIEGMKVENLNELKKLVFDLFYFVGVFGVNVVYKVGGERDYKIFVFGRDRKKFFEKFK